MCKYESDFGEKCRLIARLATERICRQFQELAVKDYNMDTSYPFYPIQSICEQADFCKDGNAARLEVLYKSALQHKDKYKRIDYDFILDHLRSIMEYIKDNHRREKARREIEDY